MQLACSLQPAFENLSATDNRPETTVGPVFPESSVQPFLLWQTSSTHQVQAKKSYPVPLALKTAGLSYEWRFAYFDLKAISSCKAGLADPQLIEQSP